jgi:ribosomal protein L27
MITLSSFSRRISADGREVRVELDAGQVRRVGAQRHAGENVGGTETHSIFVELMEPAPVTGEATLGPSGG